MNHINIQKYMTQYGYEECYWSIDGKGITEYLDNCKKKLSDEFLEKLETFNGLCPAWSKELNFDGDVRFVWELIYRENRTILPILLCPDDLDFTCIVIVVEVDKTQDFVYWNRAGYVIHEKEDIEEEKRSGILCLEGYSDEDWNKYGDNIALEDTNSDSWREWIGENWEEELFRRRMNYTLPYYETEGNVCWFHDMSWCFLRDEYESMVEEFWEYTTLEKLQGIMKQDGNKKITVDECAKQIADITYEGNTLLHAHRND